MRGFATGVGSKADMGGPITRDISEGGAGLSTPARSSSLGPTHLAGGFFRSSARSIEREFPL